MGNLGQERLGGTTLSIVPSPQSHTEYTEYYYTATLPKKRDGGSDWRWAVIGSRVTRPDTLRQKRSDCRLPTWAVKWTPLDGPWGEGKVEFKDYAPWMCGLWDKDEAGNTHGLYMEYGVLRASNIFIPTMYLPRYLGRYTSESPYIILRTIYFTIYGDSVRSSWSADPGDHVLQSAYLWSHTKYCAPYSILLHQGP